MSQCHRRPRTRALGYLVPVVAGITAVAAGVLLWAWASSDDEEGGDQDTGGRGEEQNRPVDTEPENETLLGDRIEEEKQGQAPGMREGLGDNFHQSTSQVPVETVPRTAVTKPRSQLQSFAIVLSSEPSDDRQDYLSWLSRDFLESHSLRLFILIYAPYLDLAQRPKGYASAPSWFKNLYDRSISITGDSTLVMPFTTRDGYKYMLPHLPLTLVYAQEALLGNDAVAIAQLLRFVRRVIVILPDGQDPSELPGWYRDPVFTSSGRFHVVSRSLIADDLKTRISHR